MHEAIALGPALLVGSNFAGQNIAKGGKSVVQSLNITKSDDPKFRSLFFLMLRATNLIIYPFVEVLDENIALAGFTKSRVTLRPHDPAGWVLHVVNKVYVRQEKVRTSLTMHGF